MIKQLKTLSPSEQLSSLGPFDYTLQCGACNFRKGCMSPLSPVADFTNPVDLMVIVEKPSFEEESCSFGYGDRPNQYLKSLLAPIFPLDNTYFTYLIKCFVGKNTKITKSNSSICKKTWLNKEIELFKPNRILCLGRIVSKLLEKGEFGEIKNNVGFWQSPPFILNAGMAHIELFIKFLKKLKMGAKCSENY